MAKLLGKPDRYRFFFRCGFVSDDTEHTCIVAQSLLVADGDPEKFEREMARRLKWWFVKLPAGVGRATARSMIKMWLGFPVRKCGVFSAGNGPSMRAAILGAAIDDPQQLVEFVKRSTHVTHTDPKAEYGAIAVAYAALMARTNDTVDDESYFDWLDTNLPDTDSANEFRLLMNDVRQSLAARESTIEFSSRTYGRKGVTGYTYHTVPAAIHAWLSHPDDYREAVSTIIQCGGDADSTAAIVGGIIGSKVGLDGIPTEFITNLKEWPCSVRWMNNLADQFGQPAETRRVPRTSVLRQSIRNLLFLAVVLVHGFRRLAPPY